MCCIVNNVINILGKRWYHDPTLKNENGETVFDMAVKHGKTDILPTYWKY